MALEDDIKELLKKIKEAEKKSRTGETSEKRTQQLEEMVRLLKEADKLFKEAERDNINIDKSLKDQYKQLQNNSNQLTKILLVNKGIASTFKGMLVDQKKFLTSVDEWFSKSQDLAKEYLSVAKNIGLSESRSRVLSDNFNDSVRESLKLGYSLEDLRETFSTFAEETGRARILSTEEAENIATLAKGADLYASEATKLAEAFDLMGVSSERTLQVINEAVGTSRELGLNAGKVIKVLQTNMKTMQNYSFARGVKGMTEMAKVAVKMRGDVNEMLQMADKFYQPEAAIEAAANLQLLGGDIAKAFGDPFETMYLARNKPEELADRVAKMTENMMSFNEKTGEFEMPAEARMQLQAVSKELGLSETSMITMARQASKIKNIKMDVSGNITDEDMREGIAGMARMKDGQWKVDFIDPDGKKRTKAIEDLTQQEAKTLLDRKEAKEGKTEKDYLHDIAMYSQTFSERMENFQSSMEYGFVGEADVYGATMDSFLRNTMGNFQERSEKLFGALNTAVGSLSGGDVGEGMKEAMRKAFDAGVGGMDMESFFDKAFGSTMQQLTASIENNVAKGTFDIKGMTVDAGLVNISTLLTGTKDIAMQGDGTVVMGPAGAFMLDPRDTYVGSDGGFVAGTDLYDNGVTNYGGAGGSKVDVAPINVNGRIELVSPTGEAVNLDMDKIKATIQPIIIDALNQASRNGGTLTGKETVDRGISV